MSGLGFRPAPQPRRVACALAFLALAVLLVVGALAALAWGLR